MKFNGKMVFCGIFGILYLAFGLVQIAASVLQGVAEMAGQLFIPADPAAGFALMVTGAVFLSGAVKMHKGIQEGPAFLYVGILLALAFGIIALLTSGAQAVEITFFGEEGSAWQVGTMLVPMFWLALGSAAGFLAWSREFTSGLATVS